MHPPDSSRLKIHFVFNLCPHYRIKIFEHLARKYKIRFLFFSKGNETYYDGKSGLHSGNFDGHYLKGVDVLPRIRFNPGLVFELFFKKLDLIIKCINSPLPLLIAYAAAKIRRKPFILWTGIWHTLDTPFHRFAAPIVNRVYKGADAILVYGDHVKKFLVEKGLESSKIFPAYQADDMEKHSRSVSEEEIRTLKRELGISTGRVILYVGRFVEEKGLEYLLNAFEKLKSTDVSLLLVGAGSTSSELKKRTAELSNCFIKEYVPNDRLFHYYALADIFVLPSITTATFREPWGFVVNEAMCQRCAVIVSDAVGAGVGGLIEDGKSGLVVPEKDDRALAQTIDNVLENDGKRKQLQDAAFSRIKTWTIAQMAKGFERAIAHVMHSPEKK